MQRAINLIFIGVILGLFSCARKMTAHAPKHSAEIKNSDSLISRVNAMNNYPDWLQVKTQVSIDEGGFLASGTATIRIQQDSLIWVSISKIGIEAMRVLIYKDSAYWVNHWEQTYWQGSIQDLRLKYNVPADLADLQNLLFPRISKSEEYLMEIKNDSSYILTSAGPLVKKYTIMPHLWLISSYNIAAENSTAQMNYQDYNLSDNMQIAFDQSLALKSNQGIHTAKFKINSVQKATFFNTPFQIPSGYSFLR